MDKSELMTEPIRPSLDRRNFLKGAATAAGATAAIATGGYWLGSRKRVSRALGKKVIVIGVDGMDPVLTERMMQEGLLPNLEKRRSRGGYSRLGTSTPPQSPVAWANFINGAGPGSHGIFDFIHRHPEHQCAPFFSGAETIPGHGFWETGDHRLQFDFWPFNHVPPKTVLKRQGTPFWDYLDAAGVPSTLYDIPSNYPPSPSHHGHHRCICGMGTPDLLGTYGTFQHFSEDGPDQPVDLGGGRRTRLGFDNDSAVARIIGPDESFLKKPVPTGIDFLVHRDSQAKAAVIELQGKRIVLEQGQWSRWTKVAFDLSLPFFAPGHTASGICRFYLQEVAPTFRLYVSPINIDPSDPMTAVSEPESFIKEVSSRLGPFSTTGFQEDYSARKQGVFGDEEFVRQATMVLEERLTLLDFALDNHEDGLLFFYFSSSDLQSHILWWNSDEKHPTKPAEEVHRSFEHVKKLYMKLDAVIGEISERYQGKATVIVLSDHGFANFGRQFSMNSWLRDNGYLGPPECTSILEDVDWSQTRAYGIGINGLYLNKKGRERDGIVEPGEESDKLLDELAMKLNAVTDVNGRRVIRGVYRSDRIYKGNAKALAPDLVIGYRRGYRSGWETGLGKLTPKVLLDNDSSWSADHCTDALEVPGVLFCSNELSSASPSLLDLAPSILNLFGLPTPSSMQGKSVIQG